MLSIQVEIILERNKSQGHLAGTVENHVTLKLPEYLELGMKDLLKQITGVAGRLQIYFEEQIRKVISNAIGIKTRLVKNPTPKNEVICQTIIAQITKISNHSVVSCQQVARNKDVHMAISREITG